MTSDPRGHRRYATLARAFIVEHDGTPCALCGRPVHAGLPIGHPMRATVEHTTPVRVLRRMTTDAAALLDLVCDTRLWALAHKHCQDRQGARAVNAARRRTTRRGSRAW